VAAALLITAYYLVPPVRPFAVGTIGALSVAAIVTGVRVFRSDRWAAWLLVASAVLLLAVGDVIFTVLAAASPTPPRYPGPQDVFGLAAYPPLAIGLLWLGQARLPSRDWPMVLDTAALSLAGSLLFWIALVRPAAVHQRLMGVALATAIATWVGYVAVLATSARVLLAWRSNGSLGLLAAGVAAFLIADLFYGRELVVRAWRAGTLIDLGYLLFYVLCGAAALAGSMSRVTSAAQARHHLGPVRLVIVAVALLMAPTALLVETQSGLVATSAAIAVVSGAVGVIVLARLRLSALAFQQRASREQTLREASRALVVAATDADVVSSTRDTLRRLLPTTAESDVRLDMWDRRIGEPVEPKAVDTVGGKRAVVVGELVLPVTTTGTAAGPNSDVHDSARPGRVLIFRAPMADLVELDPVPRVLADQAGSALQRIELTNALNAEERERYFRSLVLTSEDVTLISRDGRVVYATPSATAMFGRDITGEPIEDLLLTARPADADITEQVGPEPGGVDRYVRRHGTVVETRARMRDLTDDRSVGGVVTTLRDITAERRLERDLAFRASHDPLTGLANPRQFRDDLDTDHQRPRVTPSDGQAVLFIDLDDFKTVNDTHGHHIGDQLLAEVAQRIRSCLRSQDLAARIGGDEFAVLLRHITNVDDATDIAQRLADTLAQPAQIGSISLPSSASIGVAYAPTPSQPDELLRQADAALYRAKADGKHRWHLHRNDTSDPEREPS
jgi:diguanylate cyclase (GGDEF)-like protein/PAS domain S-box-containing protein